MKTMRTILRAAALLAAITTLPACSGELVGGGAREADAYATGDGTDPGGSPSLAPRYAIAPGGGAVFQAGRVTGTVSFDAKVSLVRSDGVEPVVPGATATVAASGADTVRLGGGEISAGAFPTARVVFTRVTANVSGGLVIGGVGLTGRVDVAIADSVVVQMPVNVPAGDGDVELLVDLDASAWLAAANPVTRTVSAAAFQGAVKVRIR
jgi:hypothetical protein